MKNVDDADRVEKISKDLEKSEKLAENGESTPYITKGLRKTHLELTLRTVLRFVEQKFAK